MNKLEPEDVHLALVAQAKHVRDKELVRTAIEQDYLRLYRHDVDEPLVKDDWLDQHLAHASIDPHEREWHRKLKVQVARHLDELGFEVPRMENPVNGDTPPFLYDAFEVESPYGSADVGVASEGIYAECGKTNPQRVLAAFGLVATIIRGVWQEYETETQRFVTVPDRRQDEDRPVLTFFEFTRGPKLEREQ